MSSPNCTCLNCTCTVSNHCGCKNETGRCTCKNPHIDTRCPSKIRDLLNPLNPYNPLKDKIIGDPSFGPMIGQDPLPTKWPVPKGDFPPDDPNNFNNGENYPPEG